MINRIDITHVAPLRGVIVLNEGSPTWIFRDVEVPGLFIPVSKGVLPKYKESLDTEENYAHVRKLTDSEFLIGEKRFGSGFQYLDNFIPVMIDIEFDISEDDSLYHFNHQIGIVVYQ